MRRAALGYAAVAVAPASCGRPQTPEYPLSETTDLAAWLDVDFVYLPLSRDATTRFADAYLAVYGSVEKWQLDRLRRLFILSTDVFSQSGAEVVNFATLYAPYHAPCYRPMG